MKLKSFVPALAVLALLAAIDLQLTAPAQNTIVTYQGRVTDNATNFNGAGQFQFALVTSTNTSVQATATANAPSGGFITIINVANEGGGYAGVPAVTISGGGGSGATATATVSGGMVTAINVNSPGSNYSSTPIVIIAPPPPVIAYTTYWSNDGTSVNGSEPTAPVSAGVSNGLFTVGLGDTTVPNMASIPAALFAQPGLQLRIWFNDGVSGFSALNPAQNLTAAPYAAVAQTVNGVGLSIQQTGYGAPNLIAGAPVNYVSHGVYGATIGGGGATNISGLAYSNSVTGDFGTIGGGVENIAGQYGATVSGGVGNTASGQDSTVGGGFDDAASGDESTVSGGYENTASGDTSTVSGGFYNACTGYVATVSGGGFNIASGSYSFVGGGSSNTSSNNSTAVAGGEYNVAGGIVAVVGGGYYNIAAAEYATIGGGDENLAVTTGDTIAGGQQNSILGGSDHAFIGGGWYNTINSNVYEGAIACGYYNTLANNAGYAVIGGGLFNTNSSNGGTIAGGQQNLASGQYQSAVGGGYANLAGGSYATVPGGYGNTANGTYSLAAGYQAQANHNGAFVWADGIGSSLSSTNANSVTMRASGGYRLYSGNSSGVFLAPGGASWATISDRNAKKDFAAVDTEAVLDKLAAIPVEQWHYNWEPGGSTLNLGPMAQDFKHAFYPGRDDKSITTLEFDGVELAAIQGLNQKLKEKDAQIENLRTQLDELKQAVQALANKK